MLLYKKKKQNYERNILITKKKRRKIKKYLIPLPIKITSTRVLIKKEKFNDSFEFSYDISVKNFQNYLLNNEKKFVMLKTKINIISN